jgi:uncharacterized repeat protein (TIGR03803 family)
MRFTSTLNTGKRLLAFTFVLGLSVVSTPPIQADTFKVMHNFTGYSDGGNPLSGFIIDPAGNLYGTASNGGSSFAGVVFKFNKHGVTVLHNFTGGTDGAFPDGSLVMDAAGNLYGTTTAGGPSNVGTVFEISAKGHEVVLHSFTGKSDGATPQAALVRDAAGNLYGTTTAGGSNGNGTVFELAAPTNGSGHWTESVLYSFGKGTDGAIPVAGVTFDTAGNLYGTTSAGGLYGFGTVFELRPLVSGWKEYILHNFQEGSDGGVPYAGVIFDAKGNLYGAATDGGLFGGEDGGGTVFKMTPSRSGWQFTVLYQLAGWGISGSFRNLLLDASGNIYATTHCDGLASAGTVYRLSPSAGGIWTYKSLYVFTGGTDGLFSFSNLVFDLQGNLYGTVFAGGANGQGVIFRVTP